MKSWSELTEAGQIRRIRPLGWSVLEHYDLNVKRLRLVGGFTNVLFRVDAEEGTFALRVDLHQDHSDGDVDNEIAWLTALEQETNLDVVRFVPAVTGAPYLYAGADGVPGERRCVLFRWVPGHTIWDDPDEDSYHRLGRLSGGLHLHGASFDPPHTPLTWDKVFYWPEDVDPVVVFDEDRAHFLAEGRREVLDHSIEAVNGAFDALDPSARQIIHGDLHPDNVHTYHRRLTAFDFEDITFGHRVQDIAISLFYRRDHPAYDDLRAAFKDGYETVAEWPVSYEGELEHFMAARTIMFINYVANLHDDPSDFYERAFPRLRRFLAEWT